MPRCHRPIAGFSLIELLIVIAVLAVLVGLVLPSSNPTLHDQLRSAAGILRGDLGYGCSLAVANNSTYRITFDVNNNRYLLEHSNDDLAFADLDTLPDSPFREPDDPPTQHIVDLDELPRLGPSARLVAATAGSPPEPVVDVEFDSLGQTTRTAPTTIWLAAGYGAETRYIWISVNPVTGLAQIGDYSSTGPGVNTPP